MFEITQIDHGSKYIVVCACKPCLKLDGITEKSKAQCQECGKAIGTMEEYRAKGYEVRGEHV